MLIPHQINPVFSFHPYFRFSQFNDERTKTKQIADKFEISGAKTQSGQHQAYVCASIDAIVLNRWPRWIGTNVGMGPSTSCLYTTTTRHICQSDTMPIFAAWKQIRHCRWWWQFEPVASQFSITSQSIVFREFFFFLFDFFSNLPTGSFSFEIWNYHFIFHFFFLQTYQCHNKGIADFVFLGSCSLVATAGHSSESKNVGLWDTLLPQKKSMVACE